MTDPRDDTPPPVGLQPGELAPRNPDFDRRVRDSFASQAMMETIGAEIVRLGPGWIEVAFPNRFEFTQQDGFTHGGMMAAVMDSACGYAAFSLMPAHSNVLTVEYKVNLLRPANAERYRVSGHVVKAGRTLTVCQAAAISDPTGPEIAVMTATLITLPSPST